MAPQCEFARYRCHGVGVFAFAEMPTRDADDLLLDMRNIKIMIRVCGGPCRIRGIFDIINRSLQKQCKNSYRQKYIIIARVRSLPLSAKLALKAAVLSRVCVAPRSEFRTSCERRRRVTTTTAGKTFKNRAFHYFTTKS